jgi:hypothetical protein
MGIGAFKQRTGNCACSFVLAIGVVVSFGATVGGAASGRIGCERTCSSE